MICAQCGKIIDDEQYIEYCDRCALCRKSSDEVIEIGFNIWKSFYTNTATELTLADIIYYCNKHSITYDRITLTGNEHAELSVWLDLGETP